MIDTVRFELVNLRKHAHVYNKLVFQKSADFKSVLFNETYGCLEKDDYYELAAKPLFPFYDNGTGKFEVYPEYIDKFKENPFKPRFARGGIMEREIVVSKKGNARENFSVHTWEGSYNYKIKAVLNPWDDKVTFEFSVPKYFMGCNVYQFVKTPVDAAFTRDESSLDYHSKRIHNYINFAVTHFLDYEYPGSIDYKDLYIKRVDLCYNLIFRSNEECMRYFDILFKIHKEHHGPMNGTMTPYERETIHVLTKDYSAKVYFKGAEFAKHDYLKLAQHFAKLGKEKELVDTDTGELLKVSKYMRKGKVLSSSQYMMSLTDVANRTLRYEFSFRDSYMSYIWNTCVLRNNLADWQQFKALFGKLQFITSQKMKKGEKGFFINEKNKKEAFVEDLKGIELSVVNYAYFEEIIFSLRTYRLFDGENMSLYFKRHFKMKAGNMQSEINALGLFYSKMNNWIQKTHKFSPQLSDKLNDDYRDVNTCCDLAHAVTYVFGRRLCMAMWDKFKAFIDNYTIKEMPETIKTIEQIEKMKCKPVRKNLYKLVLFAMNGLPNTEDSQKCLKDLKQELGWSSTTYQRYRKAFKEMGIGNQTFKIDVKVKFDFEEYYNILIENQQFAREQVRFS